MVCDTCGTPLSGRKRHGFPTPGGGISCGRAKTQRTVVKDGKPSLIEVSLPCARAARL